MKTIACDKYATLINSLAILVTSTELKVINSPDSYFTDNANYLSKSFLITAVTYLELYLKDIALVIVNEMQERISTNPINSNIIRWSLDKTTAEMKDSKFETFSLGISDKDIENNLSGNVYKTLKLFEKLGIDLRTDVDFQAKKDNIASIISKRNSIIHFNDDASDLTLGDIRTITNQLSDYIAVIDKCILNSIQPCLTNPLI